MDVLARPVTYGVLAPRSASALGSLQTKPGSRIQRVTLPTIAVTGEGGTRQDMVNCWPALRSAMLPNSRER